MFISIKKIKSWDRVRKKLYVFPMGFSSGIRSKRAKILWLEKHMHVRKILRGHHLKNET